MRLALATYNIRRCVGRDGRFDPERIATVLNQLRADVIALQEVESRSIGGLELLDHLARETGLEGVDGPTLQRETGRYGNALLTRARVAAVRRIDLSQPGFEARGAIDADLIWSGRAVRVVATHLGLRAAERRRQARAILDRLDARAADNADPAGTILLGDFNEWLPWGPALRLLRARFGWPPAPASFPSSFPIVSLDRIWTFPGASLERIEAHTAAPARMASDHLPVRAVLTF